MTCNEPHDSHFPLFSLFVVAPTIAQMWKDASEEEKREHTEREYDLRQKYKVKIAEWRKNSESEVDAARMARENEAMEAVFASKLEGGSSSGAPLNENHHTHTDPSPYSSPRRATAHVPPGGYAYPQQPYGYGGYEQYGYNGPEDRVPLPADPGYPYAHYYDRGTSYGAYGQQYGPSDQSGECTTHSLRGNSLRLGKRLNTQYTLHFFLLSRISSTGHVRTL